MIGTGGRPERIRAMSKIDRSTERNEDELFRIDVSDDTLEGVGGAEPWVNYTYYNCTGYGYCPGY
jgi:predicted amino acid racemase